PRQPIDAGCARVESSHPGRSLSRRRSRVAFCDCLVPEIRRWPNSPMTTIPQPAHGVWFDLESRTERVLEKEHVPDRSGFLWIDLELPAPEALADLVDSGILPAAAFGAEISAGDVRWTIEPDHVQLHLAGARMHDESLILDRREIIVADRLVASLHRGCPRYFDQLRARYGGVFPSFARSHGFLLF